jgi:hypothetical protein
MDSLDFLNWLYQDLAEGFLTLTAIHPQGGRPSPSRHLSLGDRHSWPAHLKGLLAANAQGWGGYYSIASRKTDLGRWKRGGLAELGYLPALFADLDGDLSASFKRIMAAKLPPASAMVGSGRGLHLYWRIAPSNNWPWVKLALGHIRQALEGDKTSAAQALRLPGTLNTKPGVNRLCQVIWWRPERCYALEDFLPATPPRASPRPEPRPRPKGDRDLAAVILEVLIREYGAYQKPNGWWAALCPGGHHHDRPGQHFNYSPERGVGHCFGKHGGMDLADLAQVLGIDEN